MTTLHRRHFLQTTLAASCLASTSQLVAQQPPRAAWPIAIFEKVFEGLNYDELADAVAQIGADGIEATIRPKGHIEPNRAADEVPKMLEALRSRDKTILIAATQIERADDSQTASLLKTLHNCGITHYRMAHYHVDLSKPALPQLRNFAAQAKELAALNAEIGIQGLYQNHSGSTAKRGYVGALGWDLAFMLEGIDPKALGLAFDTRHMRKDTGSSWETSVAICKPHIRAIYVKDGLWHGPRGDQYRDVPLDTGFVNEQVFQRMTQGLEPVPLCIHMEWLGYRVFEKHEIPQAIEAHQKDLQALKRWLKT